MSHLPTGDPNESERETKKLSLGIRQYRGRVQVIDLDDGTVIKNVHGNEAIEMEIKDTGTVLKIPFLITDLDCNAALFPEED